jgi:hypothetical protein
MLKPVSLRARCGVVAVLVTALLLSGSRSLSAQQRPVPAAADSAAAEPHAVVPAGDIGPRLLLGLAGGAAGMLAGAAVGYRIGWAKDTRGGCEDCGLGGLLLGATLGESLGLALGVHAGGRPRGNVAASGLAAAGIGLAGLATAVGVGSPVPLLLVPPVQLAVSISIERWTSR